MKISVKICKSVTFKRVEGSTFPKDWKGLRIKKFIVTINILRTKIDMEEDLYMKKLT